KRFQSAEDLAFALEGLVESSSPGVSPIAETPSWPSRRTAAVATLIAVLAAVLGGEYLRRRRAQTEPAPGAQLQVQRLTETGTARRAAVTQDGRYVAWVNELHGSFELRLLQIASDRDVVLLPASPLRITALDFSP